MGELETRADWQALLLDVERVRDALLTLTWFSRGLHEASESQRSRETADRVLVIAETALARADVVVGAVTHARDAAPEKGDGDE